MAEESIIDHIKVMSEKIELEDGDEKVNPIEGLTIKKGSPKVVSRYLSGPKGSCHDLCKYGIQHAIEAKPWKTAKKKVTTRERKTEEVPEENVTCLAGTKKSGSSSKPSLISKTGKSNIPVDIMEVTNEKTVTSEKNSTPFEETDVCIELNNSDIKEARSEPSSLSAQEGSKSQTKREIVKNKIAFGSSSRKETASTSKQTRTSLTGGKEKSKQPSNNPLSSKHNVKKSSSSSAKISKNLKGGSSMKNHENVEEAKPELESNDNVPDKILHVTEPTNADLCEEPTQGCDATKLLSPPPSSSGDKSLKQTSKKTSKSSVSASSRKGLRHGTRSTLSHLSSGDKGKRNMQHKMGSVSRSPSVLSSISSFNSSIGKQSAATSKYNKTELKMKSATHKRSLSASSISSSITSRGKQNGATSSKSNKTAHGSQGENVKVGYKIRPKLSTIVGAANKVVPARKLTFRRGKVIELHPQSTNIPRRLKFRPARLLGDHDFQKDINGTRKRIITSHNGESNNAANIKAEKVVHKHQTVEGSRRRIIGRKVGGDRSKIDGSKSGSEKVILRHQNMEGKKVNPRLYNNVIEETASKLAELRKSKVKALVGAFETVISLDSPRGGEATPTEVSTSC